MLVDADVNAKEPAQNQTALMWAAAEHHPDVVRTLIESEGRSSGPYEKRIHRAAFCGAGRRHGSARLLLAAGVNVNIRSQPDLERDGARAETAIHPGGDRGRSCRPPAERRALSATVSAGSTPLLVATVRGHVPLALFLLEQGADPNVGDAGFTPLHWAAGTWESGPSNPVYGFTDPMSGIPERQAKLQLVKALLAHGANPNGRMTSGPPGFAGGYDDAAGATPFLLASAVADLEMMRLLLAAGADPDTGHGHQHDAGDGGVGPQSRIGESPVTEEQALEAVKIPAGAGRGRRRGHHQR